MDDSPSEARPDVLDGADPGPVPPVSVPSGWDQQALFGQPDVDIETKLAISGTGSRFAASVTVTGFWDGAVIAVEVRPALHYPQDLHLGLAWLEERILYYSSLVSPF